VLTRPQQETKFLAKDEYCLLTESLLMGVKQTEGLLVADKGFTGASIP